MNQLQPNPSRKMRLSRRISSNYSVVAQDPDTGDIDIHPLEALSEDHLKAFLSKQPDDVLQDIIVNLVGY